MATLPETSEWVAGVYQIATTDPVLGGAPNEATGAGLTNIPALQLAKRTLFLKDLIEGAGVGQDTGTLVTNFDAITGAGFYRGAAGATGAPESGAAHSLLHVPGSTTNNAYQIAFRLGGANVVSYRRKNSGSWAAWVQIPDTTSFGTMADQDANNVTISGGHITGITDLAIADGGTGASNATSARANLGIGSAGTADVQSSQTDNTAGRVLLVGGFGVGSATVPLISDANSAVEGGFYRLSETSTNTPVAGNAYSLIVAPGAGAVTTQIAIGSAGNAIFFRGYASGTWSDWKQFYSTNTTVPVANGGTGGTTAAAARSNLGMGTAATANKQTAVDDGTADRLLAVGAFGLGGEAGVSISNFNSVTRAGLYQASAGTTNAPEGSSAYVMLHIPGSTTNAATQIACRLGADAMYFRRKSGGTWQAWAAVVTSDQIGTMAAQSAGSVTITGGSIAGISDLAVADGGTGASTASGARSNLGLGSMATQSAGAVSISGGSAVGLDDASSLRGRFLSTTGLTLVSTDHALQAGPDGATHIALDQNDIQGRDGAGGAATLNIQRLGGNVSIGGAGLSQTIALNGALSGDARATTAEAQAGSPHTKFITPATLHDAFQVSNATSGYCKFPGGLILQWGITTSINNASVTVTFPIAFTSNVRMGQATAKHSDGTSLGGICAYFDPIRLTQATITHDGADTSRSAQIYWEAWGF